MTDQLTCPYEECDAGPWPDTYGPDGGRNARVGHLFAEHGDGRGNPMNKIDRL